LRVIFLFSDAPAANLLSYNHAIVEEESKRQSNTEQLGG
jgi:hypothetical protein